MFGVFGLLNLLVGAAYPIAASFKAYDSYSRIATKTGATTINVGGVSIPLGTILKKATAADTQHEEDTLSARLISVQMWLIYWIVNAAVTTVENVFYLNWIPFYTPMRCAFSLWLIAPIVVSGTRLKSSGVMSYNDMQKEWAAFSGQGCGLVYFGYLRPFLNENLGLLNRISFEPILASISGKFVLPLAKQIGLSAFFASGESSETNSATYTEVFSGYSNIFRSGAVSGSVEQISASLGDISEYDLVDKPTPTEENELRNRGTQVSHEEKNESEGKSTTGPRHSWFW